MKKYPKYKDSGVKWIGEIPEGWETKKLKFCCHLIQEKTINSALPYIALENIESYSGKLLSTDTSVPEGLCNLFRANDVLFSKLRPYLAKCIVAQADGKCSSELLVLRDFEGDKRFLQYLMLSPKYIEYIDSSTYGAKMPRANWLFIGNSFIPLPTATEQRAIVSYLDKKTSQIDRFISEAKNEIEKLNELKQAQTAHLVTHGLNPDAPMKDSGIAWIGQIPAHWEVKRLSQVATEYFVSNIGVHHQNLLSLSYGSIIRKDIKTTKGLLPSSFDNYQVVRDGIIVLRLTDLQNDHKSLRVALAHEEGIISSAYLSILCRNNISSEYLYKQLHCNDIHKVFYGMGGGLRQSLNWQGLRNLLIVVPPLPEQEAIVTAIDNFNTKIDTLSAKLTAQINYLKELKQRIISDAVTGKIMC